MFVLSLFHSVTSVWVTFLSSSFFFFRFFVRIAVYLSFIHQCDGKRDGKQQMLKINKINKSIFMKSKKMFTMFEVCDSTGGGQEQGKITILLSMMCILFELMSL